MLIIKKIFLLFPEIILTVFTHCETCAMAVGRVEDSADSVPYYYIFRFANPLLKIHRILKQTNFEAPSNFYGMSVQDIENSVENKNTAEKI